MRQYSDNEYIKLFRKMISWEWYTDINTCHLFMHCLICANWKAGSWRGINYSRGQFITSIKSLSEETGLSFQQVRTALEHLISTNDVTSHTIAGKRVITVVNYDMYQSEQQANPQASNKKNNKQNRSSSTTNQQTIQQEDNNSIRNIKNNKEDKEYNTPSSPDGGPAPEDWTDQDEDDFIQTRRTQPELSRIEFKEAMMEMGIWH